MLSRWTIAFAVFVVQVFALSSMAAADPLGDVKAVFGAPTSAALADGVDVQKMVRIGGIDQWLSVRGRHKDAPLLLFVHGGPGFTSIPTSYMHMVGWDEYFTVVQWDQRGAGKTYGANSPDTIKATMTVDRFVADAEEVVAYLRRTYHRDKIVLVAHSWGTYLGATLAQRHPDWFYAYVGIGQMVDMRRSETLGYAWTLAAARASKNKEAVAQLEGIAPFPDAAHPERDLANLETERHWLAHFGGAVWRGDEDALDRLGIFSPDYTAKDWADRNKGLGFSLQAMWPQVAKLSLAKTTRFGCPIVFMQGRHDIVVSATLLGEWFETIDAPSKKLVWFEGAAHMTYEEEPGKALVALVNDVLPLTH